MTRISNLQLGQIEAQLNDRDRGILRLLRQLRYMKTDQVQRIFFPRVISTPYAAARATARNLTRLKNWSVITHLPNKIGRNGSHGSQGYFWYLTEAGNRLLDLGTEQAGKRKRALAPSPVFLRHTIAVTETYVQIMEICRSEPELKLSRIEVEPECWRAYQKGGKIVSLRPDLYAKTISGEYFDHSFIEMDLDTEALQFVIDKCRRYHEYYLTEKEQQATGVFPLVLWIVPTKERKQKMIAAIKDAFGNRRVHIFLVITPEELHTVLLDGAKEEDLC